MRRLLNLLENLIGKIRLLEKLGISRGEEDREDRDEEDRDEEDRGEIRGGY